MPDLLAQSAAWLNEQRHRHLTQTVTYRRGDVAVQVQATVGRTVFRLEGQAGYGGAMHYVSRDYLVRAADLVLDEQQVPPQRGDLVIELDDNGIQRTHEVMGPGQGEVDWRYADPARLSIRIHTKEIGGT